MEVYGVDLTAWFAQRRWVALLEYLDGLPTASRLNEAIMNDPATAAYLAEISMQDEGEKTPYAPRVAEWDIHATLLREAVDGIKGLRATLIGVNGGKPGTIQPFPSPRTAIEAAKEAAEKRWAVDFSAQFGFSPEDFGN